MHTLLQEAIGVIFQKKSGDSSPVILLTKAADSKNDKLFQEFKDYVTAQQISCYAITCRSELQVWEDLQKTVSALGRRSNFLPPPPAAWEGEVSPDVAQWPLRNLIHDLIEGAQRTPYCLWLGGNPQAPGRVE